MAKKNTPAETPDPEPKGAALMAMPPTPMMAGVDLDWSGVIAYARGAIRFLKEHGDTAIDALEAGFRAFKAITGRDMMGIFAALSELTVDVQNLIAAIREEFGIEDE